MERIAVIGCGLIGRSWAVVFARAGHPVKLYDPAPGAADASIGRIREALEDLRRFGLISEAPDAAAGRLTVASSPAEAVADAEYAQENGPEDLEVKRAIYRELDAAAPPSCVLASSTSTLRASRFSEGLRGRDRCIVAHPVNPPHLVPLVEISPAPWTRAEVVARTRSLLERAGQAPILLRKEVEGFVLNRLQAALLREAWRLVGESLVSVEDLDRCVKEGLGLRWSFMGPFETLDLNAPDGVAGYARRYGPAFHELFRGVTYGPWDDALVARIEGERRALLAPERRSEREAWRDRRLMALAAHKRELSREDP
jgi:3-hydroxyacyl-CoA dehydrogenase